MADINEFTQAVEKLTGEIKSLRQDLTTLTINPTFTPQTDPTVPAERLTPAKLAKMLGIKTPTVYSRSAKNAKKPFPFPVNRCGRLLRFDRSEVLKAMNRGLV